MVRDRTQPWESFARALRIALVVAAAIAVPSVLILAGTTVDHADLVLSRWQGSAGASEGTGGTSGPMGWAATAAHVGIVAFVAIPIVAYGAILVSYVGSRRRAYVIMATLQLAILLSVALGVV